MRQTFNTSVNAVCFEVIRQDNYHLPFSKTRWDLKRICKSAYSERDATSIFLQLHEAINVLQLVTYIHGCTFNAVIRGYGDCNLSNYTSSTQIPLIIAFDAGAERPIFACGRITFSTWISTRGHRYPRSAVFNYSRAEWLFKDVTAFNGNFLVTKSRILRSA